jgi:hypothetical protein
MSCGCPRCKGDWEGSKSPVNTEIHQSDATLLSKVEFSRENCVGISHHSMFVAVCSLRSRISREIERNLRTLTVCIVFVSLKFSDPFHSHTKFTLSNCNISRILCPKHSQRIHWRKVGGITKASTAKVCPKTKTEIHCHYPGLTADLASPRQSL